MKNSFDMENFDIEKLPRKNIYKTPQNFYDEMQSVVMDRCIEGRQATHIPAKVFKLNWMYAAAASLILIMGALFFVSQNSATKQQAEIYTIHEQAAANKNVQEAHGPQSSLAMADNKGFVAAGTKAYVAENLTITPKKHLSSSDPAPAPAADAANFTVKPSDKEQLAEAVFAGFSGKELADLSENTEQDVYLDLYN